MSLPCPMTNEFRAVEQGTIDILWAEPSLGRRAHVDFSIPVLLNGTGAVIRSDAPVRLRQVLSGEATQPTADLGAERRDRRPSDTRWPSLAVRSLKRTWLIE